MQGRGGYGPGFACVCLGANMSIDGSGECVYLASVFPGPVNRERRGWSRLLHILHTLLRPSGPLSRGVRFDKSFWAGSQQ